MLFETEICTESPDNETMTQKCFNPLFFFDIHSQLKKTLVRAYTEREAS